MQSTNKELKGKFIEIGSHEGQPFKGYLSMPATQTGPCIVLIQEIFGVNSHIRRIADDYANDGYFVLAPDLFWRMKPGVELGYDDTDMQVGLSYLAKFDAEKGLKDINTAVDFLRHVEGSTGKVATMGFCLGGLMSYRAAANLPVDAAVSYYGVTIEKHLNEAAQIKCPLLMHFAENDHLAPPPVLKEIEQVLKPKANVEFCVYEGVGHGFNCDLRPSYDKGAAALALKRTRAFLQKSLG
jgi:carboxymethylenebutenolidase